MLYRRAIMALGLRVVRTNDPRGKWQVTYPLLPLLRQHNTMAAARAAAYATAYYTNDLDDALAAARRMAKEGPYATRP